MKSHMAFLKKHYAAGRFLISGRKIPRDGGIIIATGTDRAGIEAIMREDPFCAQGSQRSASSSSAPASTRTISNSGSTEPFGGDTRQSARTRQFLPGARRHPIAVSRMIRSVSIHSPRVFPAIGRHGPRSTRGLQSAPCLAIRSNDRSQS